MWKITSSVSLVSLLRSRQDKRMTTTAPYQPREQGGKGKTPLLFGAIALLVIIAVGEIFQNNIVRYAWRIWHGDVVTWRGVELEIAEGYFLFSRDGDEQLMIGRFGESTEPLPDENLLMLLHRAHEVQGIFVLFGDVCERIACRDYKERITLVNGSNVRCLEFRSHLKPWPEPEFHMHCQAQGSDIMVEYHGAYQEYDDFSVMINAVLEAVTRKMHHEAFEKAN